MPGSNCQKSTAIHVEIDLASTPDAICTRNSVALNARPGLSPLIDILRATSETSCVASDVDHQLILKIVFKDLFTVTQISIRGDSPPPADGGSSDGEVEASIPRLIKCFANIQDLDFSEAETTNPHQTIELTNQQARTGAKIPLRGSKFQRCASIQIFIEENQENLPCTFVNRLSLWGYISPSYQVE